MIDLTVAYADPQLLPRAEQISQQLGLSISNNSKSYLLVQKDLLSLRIAPFLPLHADLSIVRWQHRRDARQGLILACKPKLGMKIIDTTAGWGRDAAILALFGAEVVMIERHPVMHLLLNDALLRQNQHDRSVLRLQLLYADAITYLITLPLAYRVDVIYIDPMHPMRKKDAAVKKAMAALQQLIGPDDDAVFLLNNALLHADRVVMKWPKWTKPIGNPQHIIFEKTICFCIYTTAVVSKFDNADVF